MEEVQTLENLSLLQVLSELCFPCTGDLSQVQAVHKSIGCCRADLYSQAGLRTAMSLQISYLKIPRCSTLLGEQHRHRSLYLNNIDPEGINCCSFLTRAALNWELWGNRIRSKKTFSETVSYLQCDLVSHALLCLIKVLRDAAKPHLSLLPVKPLLQWSPHDKETGPCKTQLQTIQTVHGS